MNRKSNSILLWTPGGAISNMYAMLIARFKMFPEVKEKGMAAIPRLVAFTSEHVCVSVFSYLLHLLVWSYDEENSRNLLATVFISVIPSLGIKTWEEAGFLIYRGMISALFCGWNPGRAVSTNCCHFFALTCVHINVDVSGKDHIKQGELIIGLQHFLPGMSSVWITLGHQKILLSQNLSLWNHSCCYLMRRW